MKKIQKMALEATCYHIANNPDAESFGSLPEEAKLGVTIELIGCAYAAARRCDAQSYQACLLVLSRKFTSMHASCNPKFPFPSLASRFASRVKETVKAFAGNAETEPITPDSRLV